MLKSFLSRSCHWRKFQKFSSVQLIRLPTIANVATIFSLKVTRDIQTRIKVLIRLGVYINLIAVVIKMRTTNFNAFDFICLRKQKDFRLQVGDVEWREWSLMLVLGIEKDYWSILGGILKLCKTLSALHLCLCVFWRHWTVFSLFLVLVNC